MQDPSAFRGSTRGPSIITAGTTTDSPPPSMLAAGLQAEPALLLLVDAKIIIAPLR
jgi:hypothetical protein